MQQITSTQNSLIKYLYSLSEKSKLRREHQEFLFEGKRELSLAIAAGYHIKQLFFCPAILPAAEVERSFAGYPLTEISLPVYEKLSYRSSTEGVLALAQGKDLSLSALSFNKENPLLLIAEAPEKPGNIGRYFAPRMPLGSMRYVSPIPRQICTTPM